MKHFRHTVAAIALLSSSLISPMSSASVPDPGPVEAAKDCWILANNVFFEGTGLSTHAECLALCERWSGELLAAAISYCPIPADPETFTFDCWWGGTGLAWNEGAPGTSKIWHSSVEVSHPECFGIFEPGEAGDGNGPDFDGTA